MRGNVKPIKALPGETAINIKRTIFKKGIYSPGRTSKMVLLVLMKYINPEKIKVSKTVKKKNNFKGSEILMEILLPPYAPAEIPKSQKPRMSPRQSSLP